MKPFHVYLLRCGDGSYYCGHTDELDARLYQHESGEVGYTAARKPVTLVWQAELEKREEAVALERQIKGWTRAKKEALIAGDWDKISELARSRCVADSAGPSTGSGRTGIEELASSAPALRQAQGERGDGVPLQGSGRSIGKAPFGLSSSKPPTVSAGLLSESETLIDGIRSGVRRALAKAITLVESARADHQQRARSLLQALLPDTGKSIRVGISGVPGVGKSTFIEALGLHLIGKGHRVAVLAVDPSSTVTGGSILGDKTRMEHLAQREEAFIRPSPSSGALGGVADRTRETMLLCEAAGFDVVIVETVGVGQSETAVAGMTDSFVLLQLPNAGDDLQAIKKGIVELADIVVYNKADIDLRAAEMAASQMRSALALLHPASPHWRPPVLMTSAARQEGIAEFWETVLRHRAALEGAGELTQKRRHQTLAWMWALIDNGLHRHFRDHPAVGAALANWSQRVETGSAAPTTAAESLLELFLGKGGK